jgi:uncharacterized protein YdhG (YjbR/CyaY superfamily)
MPQARARSRPDHQTNDTNGLFWFLSLNESTDLNVLLCSDVGAKRKITHQIASTVSDKAVTKSVRRKVVKPKSAATHAASCPEVDAYLNGLPEEQRNALQQLRQQILSILVPNAQEVMSYGMPGYRVDGSVVAGFAGFRKHLSFFPHSGSVLAEVADQVKTYQQTKSSLHFSAKNGLPTELVQLLIHTRIQQKQRC